MACALLALAALLAPGPAVAQSLDDALVSAYETNPQLLAERAQLRATDENVPQALSNWRPTVQITGQQGVMHYASQQNCEDAPIGIFGRDCAPKALNSTANLWPQSYGLTVTQPLYRGGQTEAETERAMNQVRAERANLVTTEQNVFHDVVSDYLNVVAAQDLVQISNDYAGQLRDDLDSTQRRLDAQELTLTDVSQARAYYAEALTALRSAQLQLDTARAAYAHDVGAPPRDLHAPDRLPKLPDGPMIDTIASIYNPAVIQAEYTVQAAVNNVRMVKGQSLPTLSLQGSVMRMKETDLQPGLRQDEFQATANLTVPLYQAGAIRADLHQVEEEAEYRRDQLDDARRAAIQSAQQARQQMLGTQDLVTTLNDQIRACEVAVDGIRHESIVGDRTVFDLLIEEQQLYQARASLIQAHHDAVLAQFEVAQAMGQLTAEALKLPVDYYDPLAHFKADRTPDSIFPEIWPLAH